MVRSGNRRVRVFFLFALILSALIALVSVARAETPAAPGSGSDNIVSLKKGAPAPFSGQLFDTPTAIRWGLWVKNYRELSAAEATKARGICEADLTYKDDLLKIEQDKTTTLTTDLKKRLLDADTTRVKLQYELDHPPWYTSAWFGFGIGAISTVAVVFTAHQVF